MGKVSYSAVVLDEKSRTKLIEKFKSIVPDEYEFIAHHMTINLGDINPEFEKYLGLTVRLCVNDIAMDDKVIAVGVSGFESRNAKPHITLAVNRKMGGKPVMSNQLKIWKLLSKPLYLTGKVTEVEY